MPARKYTEQQRLAFLALIDRGGAVRAAAFGRRREAGSRLPMDEASGAVDPAERAA